MAAGLGENVDPMAAIRAILGSYPFSVGLLREILQNSDDAKATKQVHLVSELCIKIQLILLIGIDFFAGSSQSWHC